MMILLSGLSGSGKDTFADYLVKEKGFIKLTFADVLKEEVSKMSRIKIGYFYDRDLKDKVLREQSHTYSGFTPREILIKYADKKRSKDELYFVNKVLEKIKNYDNYNEKNFVISDCRFKNEEETFKKLFSNNCYLIWMNREVEKKFDNTELVKENCDIVLDNNSEEFDGTSLYLSLKEYIKK